MQPPSRSWLPTASLLLLLVSTWASTAVALVVPSRFTFPSDVSVKRQRLRRLRGFAGKRILSRVLVRDGDNGEEDRDAPPSPLDLSELARRIEGVAASDAFEESILLASSSASPDGDSASASTSATGSGGNVRRLPVVAFDALLPGQKLSGTTTDPTFARFLRDSGLGGLFVMVSLDQRRRMLRRNGVVVRIELVDAKKKDGGVEGGDASVPPPGGGVPAPTAVDFTVRGRRRCRLVGPPLGMVARVGRWRRGYDPDGEESRLGWGDERFVDGQMDDAASAQSSSASSRPSVSDGADEDAEADDINASRKEGATPLPFTEWSTSEVDCDPVDVTIEDDEDIEVLVQKGKEIHLLLDRWRSLASDPATYENTDVVALTRIRKGFPGLAVDPSRLIRGVLADLGTAGGVGVDGDGDDFGAPPPATDPTALALWGAALITPSRPWEYPPRSAAACLRRRRRLGAWRSWSGDLGGPSATSRGRIHCD